MKDGPTPALSYSSCILHLHPSTSRQHNIERSDLVGAVWRADLAEVDNKRLADEHVVALVRVAAEVELRDQLSVTGFAHPVVDVRRPPGVGADLVGAGMDRLVFVVAVLVGHDACAIDEEI